MAEVKAVAPPLRGKGWKMARKAREKQIIMVLTAIENGCRTTTEMAEVTGLSLKHCSAWTRELCLCGLVVKSGNAARRFSHGAQPYFYEPTNSATP